MLIYRDFTFDSAHVLEGYSEDHPYGRIHGHSFRARVWIKGDPKNIHGYLVGFSIGLIIIIVESIFYKLQ